MGVHFWKYLINGGWDVSLVILGAVLIIGGDFLACFVVRQDLAWIMRDILFGRS